MVKVTKWDKKKKKEDWANYRAEKKKPKVRSLGEYDIHSS